MISESRYQTSKNLLLFFFNSQDCIVILCKLLSVFTLEKKKPIGRDGSGSFKQKMILLMPTGMLKKA